MNRRVGILMQGGQSLVEMALVLPLVLVLLLGILDLGRVFSAYIAITNASREGAVYGSFHPPTDAAAKLLIKERVLREAQPTVMLDMGLIEVDSAGIAAGSPVTVSVRYPFAAVSQLVKTMLPTDPLYIKASTVMVVR